MFCQSELSGARSKEHYVPQWLLQRQNAFDTKVRLAAQDALRKVLDVRNLTLGSMVAGRVCARCNGGWMNDLEEEMRRILPPLIKGETTTDELDLEDLLLLGRWACKVAYCHDSASFGPRRVPPSHPKKIWRDTDRLPPSVLVAAATSPFDVPIDQVDSRNWRSFYKSGVSEERIQRDSARSYKQAWQFGRLALIVAYWPNTWHTFGLTQGLLRVVWSDREKLFMATRENTPNYAQPRDFLLDAVWSVEAVPTDFEGGIMESNGVRNVVIDWNSAG